MIKIDMEMPESCSRCKFEELEEYDLKWYCYFLNELVNTQNGRLEDCPLMEDENCTFTKWDDESNTYECDKCGLAWDLADGTLKSNEMAYCPKCGRKITMEEE